MNTALRNGTTLVWYLSLVHHTLGFFCTCTSQHYLVDLVLTVSIVSLQGKCNSRPTVLSHAEERVAEEQPGWNFQILRTCQAGNLKIKVNLESGRKSHTLHCFHAHWFDCR